MVEIIDLSRKKISSKKKIDRETGSSDDELKCLPRKKHPTWADEVESCNNTPNISKYFDSSTAEEDFFSKTPQYIATHMQQLM